MMARSVIRVNDTRPEERHSPFHLGIHKYVSRRRAGNIGRGNLTRGLETETLALELS